VLTEAPPAQGRDASTRPLLPRVLRIEERETRLAARGFATCPPHVAAELELHTRTFACGFNTAVGVVAPDELEWRLEQVPAAERGFAYEGAAMALALLDLFSPRVQRLNRLLAGTGGSHVYMAHVGSGWALARLRLRPWSRLRLDPLLRWLALDGCGFHEAFFRPHRTVHRRLRPRRLRGYECRGFDQGVGRGLWFVAAADPDRVGRAIARFEPERQDDLWSGAGLAAAYAGATTPAGLDRLAELAGSRRPQLAQGAAFAAKARLRAGNVVPHTDTACRVFCGTSAASAAAATDAALAGLRHDGSGDDFERWRAAIRASFDSR
jgi:hypothetical protein